jgi:hypothetical protein
VETRGSWFEVSQAKARPYLKNKLKAKGLEA